MSTPPKLQ